MFRELKSLWYHDIIRRKKVTPFIMFVFFLASFTFSRITALIIPGINRYYSPYHIHHFFYGIAVIIITNWIALVGKGKKLMWIAAAFFGIGLGMVFDEIGMMIICGTPGTICDPDKLYWQRFNYDIIMYVVLIFLIMLYFKPFWHLIKRRVIGLVYKPWRVYHKVEKEIKKRHKAIKEEIKEIKKKI